MDKVGPYRVERLLGRGGMGEVYAGFDERLDRPVALKRIWRGSQEGETSQRRFQREARAVSRLHHPAIVQVFDWVENEDGSWIVMEHVRGQSLRDLLREGPLAPERAARLARDILEGLGVAHAAGIVHRDLKAANIMVTSGSAPGKGEQAKILDFGVAKRFDLEDPDTQLSVEGGLIGTLTAMSPEQVHGLEVGPRSDLFSAGSLLYEMLTGTSPFRGMTAAETLQKICTWLPPAPRTVASDVPAALSAFTERLMEKDLRYRPASATEALAELDAILRSSSWQEATGSRPERAEAPDPMGTLLGETVGAPPIHEPTPTGQRSRRDGTYGDPFSTPTPAAKRAAGGGSQLRWRSGLVVLVVVMLAVFALWRPQPETVHVLVSETRMLASSAVGVDLELIPNAVRTALLQGFLRFENIIPLEPQDTETAPEDPIDHARALAADEVLTSVLECESYRCQLLLKRLRSSDGQVLWAQAVEIGGAGNIRSLFEVSLAVIEHLRGAYPDARLRAGLPDLQVRPEDYAAYLRLRRQYERRHADPQAGFSLSELLAELEKLQETSPRYPALPIFEARILIPAFQETRNASYLERAVEALERAREIAPSDPRVLLLLVSAARTAGDIDEAARALEELKRIQPGNVHRLHEEARLLESQGRVDEALALMRRGLELLPSVNYFIDYSGMLLRQGDVAGARQALENVLERAPEHYDGLSRLAQLELMSGSPARAAELYERLVRLSPEVAELTNLGTAYLLVERYDEAARRFGQALELSPASAATLLNLADAELLVGRRQEALERYRQVLARIDADPRPETLLTVRAQALARLDRISEAIAAIQEAMRLSPDHPMTAYEASIVFVLVGDNATAIWNADQALQRGVDPRWFSFPWFDPVRPQLLELIRQSDPKSEDS